MTPRPADAIEHDAVRTTIEADEAEIQVRYEAGSWRWLIYFADMRPAVGRSGYMNRTSAIKAARKRLALEMLA